MSNWPNTTVNVRQSGNILDLPPEYFGRIMFILAAVTMLLLPDMIALGKVMGQILLTGSSPSVGTVLVEMIVVGTIFIFGTAIVFAATRGYEQLQWIMVAIGACLEGAAMVLLMIMSMKCSDNCGQTSYMGGMLMTIVLTIMGLVVPLIARQNSLGFVGFFLASGFLQSDIWLYQIIFTNYHAEFWFYKPLFLLWISMLAILFVFIVNERQARTVRSRMAEAQRRQMYYP